MARILIVDDDADIRTTMRMMLEEIGGHTVLEAEDGESGLQALRASEEPLVVLLDLLMPGLDGVDVLRAAAEDENLARRHAFVLVTVSRRARSREFLASLMTSVLVVPKPFDMTVLLDTVMQAEHRLHAPEAAPEYS
jgi:CheY-like chemotaxis protein